jgi:hypothetical protein
MGENTFCIVLPCFACVSVAFPIFLYEIYSGKQWGRMAHRLVVNTTCKIGGGSDLPEGGIIYKRYNMLAWVLISVIAIIVVLVDLTDKIMLGWLLTPARRRKGWNKKQIFLF